MPVPAEEFSLGDVKETHDCYSVYAGTLGALSEEVDVVLFSAECSESPNFRAAFKRDRDLLSNLRHAGLPRWLGSGERGGCVCYWTAPAPPSALSTLSATPATEEDLVEIAWQAASALQYLHNLGLHHGQVSRDTLRLSTDLRVCLVGSRIPFWVRREAPDAPAVGLNELQQGDLNFLTGWLLKFLTQATLDGDAGTLRRLLEGWQSDPRTAPQTAREYQGRLGEVLLAAGGEAMDLVDQRDDLSGGHSIMAELFDDVLGDEIGTPTSEPRTDKTAISAVARMLAIAAVLLLLWLAWQLLPVWIFTDS